MKNFKFRIYENNYNVRILSHEDNIIDLEVNGTSYSVKLKEEINTLMKEGKIVPVKITCGLVKNAMEKAGGRVIFF